ncbi:GNAT family N-acetyltransferase [Mucilaginibacter sp.]|uniref:GNAT family N-acetyltransferase n=1 Tax=Mucilaginibacter sp. TaxID=1882438 RepID=UPI003D1271AD
MSNSRKKDYTIERLSAHSLPDMECLYTAVYNKTPVNGFFAQKYNTAFTGVEYTGFIAYNTDQTPIAFYGVIPCFIDLGDRIILSAQSADTMTHPDYRNQGLFVELALHTYQLCRECGIELIFGFPNQNSLPGFVNKLGWKKTEHLDLFIIPTGTFSWGRFFRKFSLTKRLFENYQHLILKPYLLPQNGMENAVLKDGFAGVYRDHHYLQYKTYTKTQLIRIGQSILWIKISHTLLIGDLSVIPADFYILMDQLIKLARKLGLKEIHFHTSSGTTLHNLFAGRFNPIPSFPVIFKNLAGDTVTGNIKFTAADIDTF